MIGIVVSQADEASVHIGEQLRARIDWETHEDNTRPSSDGGGTVYQSDPFELRTFEEWHLELDHVVDAFQSPDTNPDLIVFASRHSGETGPLLTAHHTGNFGPAEYGGTDRSLAAAAPTATKTILNAFYDLAPEGYDVGLECTHHGPTEISVPSLFVELGSGEAEWADPAGATAVAAAIEQLASYKPENKRTFIGIGGGHYAPKFSRIVAETDWAVGHIAADWSLDQLQGPEDKLLIEMARQSAASHVVTEGSYPEIEQFFVDSGYQVVGETWLKETTGVDLDLVRQLETKLLPIEEGLRFGVPAKTKSNPAYSVQSLPATLIDDLQRISRDRTLNMLNEYCVAYETEENGNRAGDRVAIERVSSTYGNTDLPVEMVEATRRLLSEDYETVQVGESTIHVETTTFDPERAATLGVPEGPKFGRLASGEAVEVNGETIPPEAVRTRTTRTYTL